MDTYKRATFTQMFLKYATLCSTHTLKSIYKSSDILSLEGFFLFLEKNSVNTLKHDTFCSVLIGCKLQTRTYN